MVFILDQESVTRKTSKAKESMLLSLETSLTHLPLPYDLQGLGDRHRCSGPLLKNVYLESRISNLYIRLFAHRETRL